jgi:hypothetical protein
MKPRRDDVDLIAELRALRPSPRPEFAVELDRRVEAGFPRREGGSATWIERAAERLRATPPRRLLAPVGAFAVVAIVIATAIVATSNNGTEPSLSFRPQAIDRVTPQSKPFEGAAGGQAGHAGAAIGREASGKVQFSEALPQTTEEANAGQSSGSSEVGRYASHANHRDIERSSQIVLGADPADVRSDAAKVFDAVHVADGIVLSSSIRDGAAGEAGARFDLLIPSGKLSDTLAAFSSIDEVLTRHESTQDITAPTIRLGERLQDSQAKIKGLLAQLATTTSDTERAAVEAELRSERARAAALRSRLAVLNRRDNLSRVSLRIETGESSGSDSTGGTWGIGDGLHDAGRILAIAAGIAVVGLALAVPLALLFLLAWLVYRTWVRSRREQALSRRV